MAAPTISPLPALPTFPKDQPKVFFPRLLEFLSGLDDFGTQANALAAYLDSLGLSGGGASSGLSIGLFTAAAALAIPASANIVKTSGHSVDGKGSAEYVYDAAVDAAYVAANPKTSFRDTTGRGFKLIPYQTLNWHMFGLAVNDDTGSPTNDGANFVAMLAWQKAQRKTGGAILQYGSGAGPPIWCFGACYLGSTSPVVDYACSLKGFTRGVAGASPTQLRFDANTSGITFDSGSAGHEIEGFSFRGGWNPASTGTAGDEGEIHAVQWHSTGIKRNLQFYNWQGAGLKDSNDAASSGGTHNSNEDVVEDCFGQACRSVYELDGGDTNGKRVTGISGISNRKAVVHCKSFLGNGYGVIRGEANGYYPNWANVGTTAARPACLVYHAGNSAGTIWACIGGQETWCQTNAPPTTGTYNQGWIRHPGWPAYSEVVANSFGIPTWISGGYYRPGGCMIVQGDSNRSTVDFLYSEDDQLNQFDVNVGRLAGNANNNITVNASSGTYYPSTKPPFQRGSRHDYNMLVTGTLTVQGFQLEFGPVNGTATDTVVNINTTNSIFLQFKRYDSAGALIATDGSIRNAFGATMVNGVSGVKLQFNGSDIATIVTGGLNLLSGKVLTVSGTQVVGARDTGWTAGTGTANKGAFAAFAGQTRSATYVQSEAQATDDAAKNASQRIKAIEDALRTHGLIN